MTDSSASSKSTKATSDRKKTKRKSRKPASGGTSKAPSPSQEITKKPESLKESSPKKHRFRIELSQHDENWQGKIEHLLSRNKRLFTGLDANAILDFIHQKINIEESETQAAPTSIMKTAEMPEAEVPQRNHKQAAAHIESFSFYLKDPQERLTAIRPNKAFMGEVILNVDPPMTPKDKIDYQIDTIAEQLDGIASIPLCNTQDQVALREKNTANICIRFPLSPLPPGYFQLKTVITLRLNAGHHPSTMALSKKQIRVF